MTHPPAGPANPTPPSGPGKPGTPLTLFGRADNYRRQTGSEAPSPRQLRRLNHKFNKAMRRGPVALQDPPPGSPPKPQPHPKPAPRS